MFVQLPLILDGAMGTRLYKAGMGTGDCPERWSLENRDKVVQIQRSYVDAGSQVLYSPTFGANPFVLASNGITDQTEEYNRRLVSISAEASGGRALIAGDMSPTGRMLYPIGDLHFEDMVRGYRQQAEALEKAGVDLFVIETIMTMAEARAAVLAVKSVSTKPIFVSFSCQPGGRTMLGTDICAAYAVMEGMGADAFGMNCSSGPAEMIPSLQRLGLISALPMIAKPNAGVPKDLGGSAVYDMDPEEFASYIPQMLACGVSIFGGCCGTDQNTVAQIKKQLEGVQIRPKQADRGGKLLCASERRHFLLDPSVRCGQVFECGPDLEDLLTDLEGDDPIGIRIGTEADLDVFEACQYAVDVPLFLFCEDAGLLERALRLYQGRALYSGSLSEEILKGLCEKYGLIY